MKRLILALFVGTLASIPHTVLARGNLDCDAADRAHPLCNDRATPGGVRCGEPQAFANNCAEPPAGVNPALSAQCAAAGGCFGDTESSKWYTYTENGKTYRCQCGCFAEDTMFATALGLDVSGKLLTAGVSPMLLGLGNFDGRSLEPVAISSVVSGPEYKPVWQFATSSGKSFTLTENHPLLLVDSSGQLRRVATAKQAKLGDFVLNIDGVAEEIVASKQMPYQGKVVNFAVESQNPSHHFVAANDIMLGDNVWQQQLARTEARLLERDDIIHMLLAPRQ